MDFDEVEDEDEEVDNSCFHDVPDILQSLFPLEGGRPYMCTNTGVITDTEIVCVQIQSLDARLLNGYENRRARLKMY